MPSARPNKSGTERPARNGSFQWDAIDKELARLGYVTRSGRPWTLWNVRSAYSTATRIGTIE